LADLCGLKWRISGKPEMRGGHDSAGHDSGENHAPLLRVRGHRGISRFSDMVLRTIPE